MRLKSFHWIFALLILFLAYLAVTTGCTSAYRSKIKSLGVPHTIKLYNGGKQVEQWVSAGVVKNETQSDGFYFTDKDTGKLVRIANGIVIYPTE